MELYQIRYFLTLAKCLNFTRAAEVCNVTQPALTKAIQKLEQELGGDLLHRERQLTQLTDLGKLLLPMIERTSAAAETVRQHANEFQRKNIAPLKVAVTPCISAALVVESIAQVVKVLPGLQVELVEVLAEAIPELLLEGGVNAAISERIDAYPERIDHWQLFQERFLIFMSETDPLADYAAVPIAALTDTPWLEVVGCEVWRRFWADNFPEGHEPKIAHRGYQMTHLQTMAAAGLGVMLVSEHTPQLSGVQSRPILGDSLQRDVLLLVVAGRHYSPALDAFIKTVRLRDWAAAISRVRPQTIRYPNLTKLMLKAASAPSTCDPTSAGPPERTVVETSRADPEGAVRTEA